MATKTIDINLTVTDKGNSLKGIADDAKRTSDELLRAQLTASKLNASKPMSARAENANYNTGRALGGGTKASARDFAQESQGLGGLVRLYATYAANVFAAGAAFRALSDAADTTNMARGMDQLGAVSGRSLGTLAKRLVEVTDGAISMRESMEAVTKGSAAGLSSKQMTQMAEVAKKASQALGISMPDAMSRLSRGVSKLEPELLDELGLYTKLDKANQDYARSIGKSATTLTDFERRQAFANAVLKEGLDKFSSINIDANPYDKLLASLKNVSQQTLELVNTALTPLVALLAASPSGLMAVLGGIGVMLLKQAIPAIGMYRQGLAKAAEESRARFGQIYKDQQVSLSDLAINAATQAEAAYRGSASVIKKTKELEKSAAQISDTSRTKWSTLAAKDPFELTTTELKSLDNRVKTLTKKGDAEADVLRTHLVEVKKLRAEATKQGDIASEHVERKTTGGLTTAGQNDILYKRQMTAASMDAIKSTVAETQATYGMRAAFAKLGEELNLARAGMRKVQVGVDATGNAIYEAAPKTGKLQAAVTGVSTGLGIVGTKIAKTVDAFSPWLVGIGLAIEALSLFDSWMSKTGRESEAFDKALGYSKDAVDNVTRTLSILSKAGGIPSGSISGILALSNASTELVGTTEQLIMAQTTLKSVMSTSNWDSAKNWLAGIFGKDVDTQLAKTLTSNLQSALKLFEKSGQAEEAKKAFKEALGIDSLDPKSVLEAFKSTENAADKYQKKLQELNSTQAKLSASLQNFKSTTENSVKAYQEFIQSTANNNPLFKLGASLANVSLSMQDVAQKGVPAITAAFDDLAKNPEKLAQFGQTFVSQFLGMRDEFQTTFKAYKEYGDRISDIDSKIAEKKAQIAKKTASLITNPLGKDNAIKVNGEIKKVSGEISALEARKAGFEAPNTSVFERAKTLFVSGITAATAESAKLIEIALGQAAEKAALTLSQAKLGGLTGERLAVETARLQRAEIDIQLKAIDTNISLIKSNELLRTSINESLALAEVKGISSKDNADTIKYKKAELLATSVYKLILQSGGKMEGKIFGEGNELANALLQQKLNPTKLALAQQQAAKTEQEGRRGAVDITESRAAREGRVKDTEKLTSLYSDILQQESTQYSLLGSIANAMDEVTTKEQQSIENKILENKQTNELSQQSIAIRNAVETGNAAEMQQQLSIYDLIVKRQAVEKDNKASQDKIKLLELAYTKNKLLADQAYTNNDLTLKFGSQAISSEQELLGIKSSLGLITDAEAEKERNSLIRQAAYNEYQSKSLKVENDKANAIDEVNKRIESAKILNKDAIPQLLAEKAAIEARWTREIELVDQANSFKMKAIDLNQSMSDRVKGFSQVVENSFQSMADALVEFTKTGKLNFTDLVTSMMADLIRFELRAQMSALYKGSGVSSWIGSLFGTPSGNGIPTSVTGGGGSAGDTFIPNTFAANGAAYDNGIMKFAKGGTFSNSIVDSPTMFKFAKGTGLMGEAGPEAIMPLTRDNNGRLGVTAANHGSNVDIVVNNYSNAQATTNETTDSRGNRRIEVVIGDMVAKEVGRTGSATQQALTGTFGSRPAVARR